MFAGYGGARGGRTGAAHPPGLPDLEPPSRSSRLWFTISICHLYLLALDMGENHQRLQVVFHAAVVFGGNVYTLARLKCFHTFKVAGLPDCCMTMRASSTREPMFSLRNI